MQSKYIRMMIGPVYLISAVPVIIYAGTALNTSDNLIVISAIMFALFVCLLLLFGIIARQHKRLLAKQLFAGEVNCINTNWHLLSEKQNQVEVMDPVADDFLRVMGTIDARQEDN